MCSCLISIGLGQHRTVLVGIGGYLVGLAGLALCLFGIGGLVLYSIRLARLVQYSIRLVGLVCFGGDDAEFGHQLAVAGDSVAVAGYLDRNPQTEMLYRRSTPSYVLVQTRTAVLKRSLSRRLMLSGTALLLSAVCRYTSTESRSKRSESDFETGLQSRYCQR